MELHNRRILLTGASGGIGSALAQRLAAAGARLALAGRRHEALAQLASSLPGASIVVADLATADGCRAAVEQAKASLSGVDVLVHLAGQGSFRCFIDEDADAMEQMLRTNCASAMWLAQAVLPQMTARGDGQLVFCGSVLGALALPGYTVYAASKFALRGFSEGLRRELADSGVSVTYVAPRAVRTALNPPEVYEMAKATRMAVDTPEAVAEQILAAMRRDAREAVLGWPESWFVRLNALWPALVDRAMRKQAEVVRRFAKPHPTQQAQPEQQTS